MHGVWLTGSISPYRSVVSVYVAVGSEGGRFQGCCRCCCCFCSLSFSSPFYPSKPSASPRSFIFFYFHCIYMYIYIYSRFERRSVSGRRCGPVDERYHPVMVYLNQPSGSLLRVDGKKERKKEKEEKNLVRPASLVWYGDTDRLIDARGSATVLPSLKYRSHTVALIETRVEIDTLRMATILLQRSLPV